MELKPTFKGYIHDEADALLLLQATLEGRLQQISRRPYEIERPYLIVSGSAFVFVEEMSGIKRWTDGVPWSPSRISGRFLIYKGLDKSYANPVVRKRPRQQDSFSSNSTPSPTESNGEAKNYTGFVKKTMSVKFKNRLKNSVETLHLVSYYNVDDVRDKKLIRPRDSPLFRSVKPSADLLAAVENTTLGNSTKFKLLPSTTASPSTTTTSSASTTNSYSSSSCPSSTGNSPLLNKITAGSSFLPYIKRHQTDPSSLVPPQIIPATNSFLTQQQLSQNFLPFTPPPSANYTSQPLALPHLNPQQPQYYQQHTYYQLRPPSHLALPNVNTQVPPLLLNPYLPHSYHPNNRMRGHPSGPYYNSSTNDQR